MTRLTVLTLNLLHFIDRWEERLPLLLADFAALQPHVAGLQEVVYPMQQDRVVAAAGHHGYVLRRGWAGRPEYGNTLAVRDDVAAGLEPAGPDDRVDLGLTRSAHAAVLRAGAATVRVANTHLHHLTRDDELREGQVARLLSWLDGLPPAAATVVTGDFNTRVGTPPYERMREAGYRSAYVEVHGHEPDLTWPSGLVAPAMEAEGPPGCLDYVWVRGDVRAVEARVCFDRPAAHDPTLFPSDHRGVLATLELA